MITQCLSCLGQIEPSAGRFEAHNHPLARGPLYKKKGGSYFSDEELRCENANWMVFGNTLFVLVDYKQRLLKPSFLPYSSTFKAIMIAHL